MKYLVLVACLCAPALAYAEDPPTVILPTQVVTAIMQRLAQDPAVQMLQALQKCIGVQVPNAQGELVSHGECPSVTEAMHPKAPEALAAQKPAAQKPTK